MLPVLWALIHHAPYIIRYAEYTSDSAASSVTRYEPGEELRIYRLSHDQNSLTLQFFTAARNWQHFSNLGYSIHLVDQVSGASLAGVNAKARRNRVMPYGFFNNLFVYMQQVDLDFPASIPPNRALWIVMTSWKQDGDQFTRQQIHSSDFPTLSVTQVILRELVLSAVSKPAADHPVAKFGNGLVLEGVSRSSQVRTGQPFSIAFSWRSGYDHSGNLTQFLHFRNRASGAWSVYDQQPLGARLPTRLWYKGLTDSEIWQIPLPDDLEPGKYELFTGLYRDSDKQRLVSQAADGTRFAEARVPLGNLTILNQQ